MRTALFSFLGVATAVTGLTQGTIQFDNHVGPFTSGAIVDAPFYDQWGGLLETSHYVAQLYAWQPGEGFLPVAAPVPFATNGYFFGHGITIPFRYANAWVQVRAWEVAASASFEEAALAGAWTGVSTAIFIPSLGDNGVPPTLPAPMIGLAYPGPPFVVRQPQSQSVVVGQGVTLSVIASSGVKMSYQWYQQPSERPDGLILNATNSTYITSPLSGDATFWVSVANSAGSTNSEPAQIKVLPSAPRLTLELLGDQPLLTLTGPAGAVCRVESSADMWLLNWSMLVEVRLSESPLSFVDSHGANTTPRFYRAVVP